jgi:hypothetical protein
MTTRVLPDLFRDVKAVDLQLNRACRGVRDRILETTCAIRGHDYFLKAAGQRLFLRCADCGHETDGWDVGEPDATAATRP